MKRKTTLCLVLSIVLVLLLAGGCGRGDHKKPNTSSTPGSSTPGSSTPGNSAPGNSTPGDAPGKGDDDSQSGGETDIDPMTTLRGLIGKAEAELVRAFGEGEAVVENAVTKGRRYTLKLLGEEMPVYVVLDEKGSVLSAEAELPDADEARWSKALTEAFGEPKTADGAAGSQDNRPQWVKDGAVYAIQKANDKLALRITGEKPAR